MIGTALLAVPHQGAAGLALAYAVSYLIHTTIQFWYFWVYVRKGEAPGARFSSDSGEERLWG
jgi:hypothetical protein